MTIEQAEARPATLPMRPAAARFLAAYGPALATMVIAKVLTLTIGALGYQIFADELLPSPYAALAIWNRWDAPHYLDLAQYGYVATGEQRLWIVFYPLFPWLTRLVGWPIGDYLIGAFVVATVASLVTAVLLDRLVRLDHDAATARPAVWFLCIFPTAYFLHIGYTESLFLALALGSFLAARTGRWPLAGLLGALACLTRVNGLLLGPALAVEALWQWRQTRRLDPGAAWLALLPLGFAGYLLINYRTLGDPFAFLAITREHWHKSFAPPWEGVRAMLASAGWRPPVEIVTVIWQQAFFLVLILAGTVAAAIRLRPSYAVWMGLNLLLVTSTSFILSVPRYSLILFPLPILFALLARRPAWHAALSAGSLLLLAILATLFVLQRGLAY